MIRTPERDDIEDFRQELKRLKRDFTRNLIIIMASYCTIFYVLYKLT